MSDLPYQQWYERDFASDPAVRALPWLTQCVFRCVLQVMWSNHGWLPVNDASLARLLGCHVRTWLSFKPDIVPLLKLDMGSTSSRSEADNGPANMPTYRQKRISGDWDEALERRAKNKARTAAATAERSRKAKQRRSVTVEEPDNRNENRQADRNDDRAKHRNGPLPPYTPAPAPYSSTIEHGGAGAPLTPPEPAAKVGSHGLLAGRSPPLPSEPPHEPTAPEMTAEQLAAAGERIKQLLAGAFQPMPQHDIPAYQHKPWEIASDEPEDAQSDDDPEPGGHRMGQGELPDPEGAAPPDTGPAQGPEAEGGDRTAPEPDDAFPDEGIISRALRRGKPP